MSKYTTELRYLIDNETLILPTNDVLTLKGVLAGYPLTNAGRINPLNGKTRREELNEVIEQHFYFREIGFLPANRFLYHLRRKFNEIMPVYNQRFDTIDIEFNPLFNVDMTETYTHDITGTGVINTLGTNTNKDETTATLSDDTTTTTSNNGDNLSVHSDTPNQSVTESDIKANTYASSTDYSKGAGTATDTTEGTKTNVIDGLNTLTTDVAVDRTDNTAETYTRKTEGSSAGLTFSHALQQWRDIIVNINMEIVGELEDLFMQIY